MARVDTATRSAATSIGLAVPGGCIGFAVAWTSNFRPSQAWAVWAFVATALTAVSWALLPYGIRRWRALNGIAAVRVQAVVGQLVAVVAMAALAGVAFQLTTGSAAGRVGWRAGLLILTVGIGALPAMATIAGVGQAADSVEGSSGDELDRLVQLRRQLQGPLVALGGIVALLVIAAATGATMGENASPATSLLFGGVMSALVAMVYVPSAERLRRRGIDLVRQALPIAGHGGERLAELVDKRAKLDAALGVDKTVFSDLQANLVVLGPLIASAAAAFLQS